MTSFDQQIHALGLGVAVISLTVIGLSSFLFFFWESKVAKEREKHDPSMVSEERGGGGSMASVRTWRTVHMIAQYIFLSVVLGGSLTEMTAFFLLGEYKKMFALIPYLDHFVALPSLGLICYSGTSIVQKRWHSRNQPTPPNIRAAMVWIQLYGAYWLATDKGTQSEIMVGTSPSSSLADHSIDKVFWIRAVTNTGSCFISWHILSLMRPRKGLQASRPSSKRDKDA